MVPHKGHTRFPHRILLLNGAEASEDDLFEAAAIAAFHSKGSDFGKRSGRLHSYKVREKTGRRETRHGDIHTQPHALCQSRTAGMISSGGCVLHRISPQTARHVRNTIKRLQSQAILSSYPCCSLCFLSVFVYFTAPCHFYLSGHTARINGTSQILCPSAPSLLSLHLRCWVSLPLWISWNSPSHSICVQIIALSLKSLRDTSAAVHITNPVFAAVHEQRRYVRSTPVIFCSTIL